MNLDDVISKFNSIDPVALEERLRLKPPSDKSTKKDCHYQTHGVFNDCVFDNQPRIWLTLEEAQAVLNTYAQAHSKLNAYGKAFYESLKKRIEQKDTSNE